MDTSLIWLGIIFIAVLAIFLPRNILALIAWFMLDYGLGGGIILTVLAIIAILLDYGGNSE